MHNDLRLKGDSMNFKQRDLLRFVVAVQIVISIFLPYRYGSGDTRYGFIFTHDMSRFDFYLYFFEWSMLVTLGFVFYHLLRDR